MLIVRKKDLKLCPFDQFSTWFDQAKDCADISLPDAMTLSTVGKKGYPASRVVLLKDFDEKKGFVFYTNFNSQKGKELKARPKASLNFYWMPLGHQVRIVGDVKSVTRREADAYFATRPRLSQLGAWASHQSEVLESRSVLENRFAEYEKKFHGKNVPRPSHWGGYSLIPFLFEFWVNQDNRLHDRFVYSLVKKKWVIERLSP